MDAAKNPLGLWTLAALVVANMIGAGVFTTSGFALGDLGSPGLVLAAWFIGGLVALCGAVSYGALIRARPESGGEYLFLSRGIHPLAGFLGGWISLLAGFTGAIAYAAITFVAYAAPALTDTVAGRALATAMIAVAAALHGFQLRPGAAAQNWGVAIKLLAIALFAAFAVVFGGIAEWPGWSSLAPAEAAAAFPLAPFALTLMWISFSYSGFNAAIYLAGEVPNGRAVVPRALVLGTVVTMFVYLVLNAIFVLAPPIGAVRFEEDVAAIAALTIGGEPLALAVRTLIALALLTSISAMVMVGPRVYAKMADDGLFPRVLRFRGEIPRTAIWMQALLAIVVVWLTGLRELLSYLGFTLGLGTAATVATVFVFKRRDPTLALPGYPWAPTVYVVCTLVFAALGATLSPVEVTAALATVASGSVAYFAFARKPGDVHTE